MRLRPALSIEAPKLAEILVERQKDSRYAGEVDVDEPYARKLLAHAIHRHGGTHEGASFVMVAGGEPLDVQAFILGSLNRVYGVGTLLAASDDFLLGRKDCSPVWLVRLFDAYVEWASANPKVYEIGGSWSDAIPGSEGFDSVFDLRGFTRCATTYRRKNLRHAERIAA